jgi:hypothetical protein
MISVAFAPNEIFKDAFFSFSLLFTPWDWRSKDLANDLYIEIAKLLKLKTENITYFSSGRSAILNVLKALDLKEEEGVLVQTFTCEAVVLPILALKLIPQYVDIEKQTYSMDIQSLKKRIRKNSKVIILQHSFAMEPKYRNNSNRYINFGSINRTAKASYDGWNLHAGTGISRLIKIDQKHIIAPQFRLDYFVVGNQSYTENGANSLNLHVNSQQQAQLIPAFEVKGNHQLNSKFSLSLNAGLGYDLLNNRNNVSATFENSDAAFTTRSFKPSPWIVRSGFGVIYKQSNDVDLTARYDRRDRSSYINQTFSINVSKVF